MNQREATDRPGISPRSHCSMLCLSTRAPNTACTAQHSTHSPADPRPSAHGLLSAEQGREYLRCHLSYIHQKVKFIRVITIPVCGNTIGSGFHEAPEKPPSQVAGLLKGLLIFLLFLKAKSPSPPSIHPLPIPEQHRRELKAALCFSLHGGHCIVIPTSFSALRNPST